MKKIVFVLAFIISFISCEQKEIIDSEQPQLEKVLGGWELYRTENLESVIDQWTGTAWTYKNQWFSSTSINSAIILEFKDDGTFLDRYANVVSAKGIWAKIDENNFYFDYIQDTSTTNDALTQRRYVTFYCDNTFSITIEGDEKSINYYQQIGSLACSNLITYKVNN